MSYSELRLEIENAPRTWLPALLVEIVRQCEKERVFLDGGLVRTVESIIKHKMEVEDDKGKK